MNATQVYKHARDLERDGLKRLKEYLQKHHHNFTEERGFGHDGFIDDVVPVEVKVYSHTRHRPQGTFPAHISAKQMDTILHHGGLLVHVTDRPPHFFIYDKKAITKRHVSAFTFTLDYGAKLSAAAFARHVRAVAKGKAKKRGKRR